MVDPKRFCASRHTGQPGQQLVRLRLESRLTYKVKGTRWPAVRGDSTTADFLALRREGPLRGLHLRPFLDRPSTGLLSYSPSRHTPSKRVHERLYLSTGLWGIVWRRVLGGSVA